MSGVRKSQIYRELSALFGELAAVEDAPTVAQPAPAGRPKRRGPLPPRSPLHPPSDLDREKARHDLRRAGYRVPRRSA